jgi:hypothetical protein
VTSYNHHSIQSYNHTPWHHTSYTICIQSSNIKHQTSNFDIKHQTSHQTSNNTSISTSTPTSTSTPLDQHQHQHQVKGPTTPPTLCSSSEQPHCGCQYPNSKQRTRLQTLQDNKHRHSKQKHTQARTHTHTFMAT